ncbi:MAG: peptidase M23 [Bacillaceae bacterium]|jgi:stage II sporulation protein Q|uniref:M23 family metallopeptidase n=1 Tax=Aeribacillus TaxID=1055323 RepID=UPI000E3A8082|nr:MULTISPECIES: M23 family metallopeptidase [Aeribacillus]REJ19850.1 MAG: peptidase M23 [Bacillaceae bacterium]MED0651688.1 M23 family metallopeptidase [Aeribacillus composti]MED1441279.1 M23 family metallopeptidase [Aeribacillus composti]MED4487954.1 M23 family metallopeptidase [Aeribacillus pallidus]RZI50962.1 M23 family peptidase [Aeribacillus pallidus]
MREEEKKRTSQGSKFQQFFRKKWVFPAIYLVSAAVILTAVLWYQAIRNNDANDLSTDDGTDVSYNEDQSVEVNQSVENFKMPAIDPDAVKVVTNFYDFNASEKEQETALVFHNNTYHPNQGIDIASNDGKAFEVTASLSGTVAKAEKDSLLGYVVEIEHENGVKTIYQSLADTKVQAGDKVKQGEIIGQAGKNQFNKDAGVHVHFEIRKDGKAYNPLNYMDEPLTSLTEKSVEEPSDGAAQKEDNKDGEEATSDETAPSDETQPDEEQSQSKENSEQEKSDNSTTKP